MERVAVKNEDKEVIMKTKNKTGKKRKKKSK
jgi:hypothetical protein